MYNSCFKKPCLVLAIEKKSAIFSQNCQQTPILIIQQCSYACFAMANWVTYWLWNKILHWVEKQWLKYGANYMQNMLLGEDFEQFHTNSTPQPEIWSINKPYNIKTFPVPVSNFRNTKHTQAYIWNQFPWPSILINKTILCRKVSA